MRAFPHEFPDDWKVNPKTGEQLWRDEEVFLLEKDVAEESFEWRKSRKKAFVELSRAREEHAYVSRIMAETNASGDDASIKGVNLLDEKKFLEELLTPYGL